MKLFEALAKSLMISRKHFPPDHFLFPSLFSTPEMHSAIKLIYYKANHHVDDYVGVYPLSSQDLESDDWSVWQRPVQPVDFLTAVKSYKKFRRTCWPENMYYTFDLHGFLVDDNSDNSALDQYGFEAKDWVEYKE